MIRSLRHGLSSCVHLRLVPDDDTVLESGPQQPLHPMAVGECDDVVVEQQVHPGCGSFEFAARQSVSHGHAQHVEGVERRRSRCRSAHERLDRSDRAVDAVVAQRVPGAPLDECDDVVEPMPVVARLNAAAARAAMTSMVSAAISVLSAPGAWVGSTRWPIRHARRRSRGGHRVERSATWWTLRWARRDRGVAAAVGIRGRG